MRPPPAAVAKGPAAAPPVTANLAALREHWEALAAQHARACPVASRRMKPGAAPPSVKPMLLRAQDQGREPSLVVLDGPPPGTSETMLTDRGRLHRTSIRVNGGARNQVIMRAHSCLRSCLLVLGRAAAHRRAERRWGRKTERDLSDESTGDTRVDLSRTSAIQRLRETQGWTVFHLPSTRSVLETPSTPWLRAHRPHASVLDDEQRRPASRRPPGGPAAAAGQPPSFARRLRVRVLRRPPPAPCSILLPPHGHAPRHAGPSSPWRLPTAAFSWTPVAPTQSRRPSSCLLECWLDQPPALLQSPARDATVHDPRRACDARAGNDDDERRLLGSISARCTPDPSLPSRTPSSDRPMGVGHSVVHARWPPSPAATAPHLPRLSTAPRLPSSASVTLTGTRSSASFRSLNCSPSLTAAACVAFFVCRLQSAVNTFRPPFQSLCSVV